MRVRAVIKTEKDPKVTLYQLGHADGFSMQTTGERKGGGGTFMPTWARTPDVLAASCLEDSLLTLVPPPGPPRLTW